MEEQDRETAVEEIVAKLQEVTEIFDRVRVVGSTIKKREESFRPIAQKIDELRRLAADIGPILQENIDRIENHYGAVFRIRPTNDHSAEQHLLWVESAIRGIKRELHAFQKSNTPLE